MTTDTAATSEGLTMGVKFEDVLASFPPDRRAKIADGAARLEAEYLGFESLKGADLDSPEARAKFASLSEEYRAELLRLEADKLRRYARAMGGEVRITAEFPGSTVVLDD